jgi:chemotaxis protein histidine kinase CheA
VDWNQDEELLQVFRTEMEDRAPRLVAGAEAMIAGTLTTEITSDSMREAHTVKGTARVMGFNAIADAGARLESDWKAVIEHDLDPTADLGRHFLAISQQLFAAVDAHPDEGTPELSAALRALIEGGAPVMNETTPSARTEANEGPAPGAGTAELPAPTIRMEPAVREKPELTVIEGTKGEGPPVNPNAGNLGGLLAASEPHISGETTAVETSKLYRLINRVAELRLDGEVLSEALEALRMAATSSAGEVAALSTSWERVVADLNEAVVEIQDQAVALIAVPLSTVTGTVPGLVRFLSKKTGKEIRLEIIDDDIEVDLQILDRLADALRNLIVNAVEHGIERPEVRIAAGKAATGTLSVVAESNDGHLSITVADDGAGIEWRAVAQAAKVRGLLSGDGEPTEEDLRKVLFYEGISTSPTHSELSGSGQGFKVISQLVRDMGGTVNLETDPEEGTSITITVPAFQSLQRALIVEAAGRRWGIADPAVLDHFPIEESDQVTLAGKTEIVWREGALPLSSFAAAAGLGDTETMREVVVLATQSGPAALGVSAVVGVREVASKGLGPLVSGSDLVTGAALLGAGEIALMLDANSLGEASRARRTGPLERLPVVLIVDDSPGVRQIVAGSLAAGGFETIVAGSTAEAIDLLSQGAVDALVVDYSMPGSDGISLVEEVRSNFGNLPIIMMSAVAEKVDQERAKAAGVNAYFDKADFREGALMSTLQSLLEAADGTTEAQAQ